MPHERGEARYCAKLTEGDVRAIRERAAIGVVTRELARDYGVSHVAIQKVVVRKTWKHVV